MSLVPVKQETSNFGLFLQPETPAPPAHDSRNLLQLFRIVVRKAWLIVLIALLVAGAAAAVVLQMPRVYRASTSLRIDDHNFDVLEAFRSTPGGTELVTEMEVLRSRSLAEDAVTRLGLQLRMVEPLVPTLGEYLTGVTVRPDAPAGEYTLYRTNDGRYSVRDTNSAYVATASVGERTQFRGVGFVLTPRITEIRRLRLVVSPLDRTVEDFTANLTVTQSNREARIVVVQYEDTDRNLVWQVPNFVVSQFMARRLDSRRSEAASSVVFLRSQVDTISAQLTRSEGSLRQFREREQVVNPEVESSSQVARMVNLQAQRGEVEAERSAFARALASIDSQAAALGTGDASPYRRLLAFPTLLKNPVASELLRSLATVEDQRSDLLIKRTPSDPDIQVLTNRIGEIETQLRSLGVTYLQGLTDQVTGMDSVLSGFGSQLAQVPRRELEYARLERQPKVLGDMYALLQTKLKEAEIAAAAGDPSIQVVDPAVSPIRPVKPMRVLIVLGTFLGTVILGVGVVIAREYFDKSVHTRADVHGATGLPVVGLIPTMRRQGGSAVLIARKGRRSRRVRGSLPAVLKPAAVSSNGRSSFAILQSPEVNVPPGREAAAAASRREPVRHATIEGIGTAVAEAYGSLQTNIAYTTSDAPIKLLLITSSMPGEGKTTTAVNLALTFGQRGLRVLLMDTDLRRGTIHGIFEGARGPGISEVLRGSRQLSDVVRVLQLDEGEAMHYVPTGSLPSYPTQLLESEAMRELLLKARNEYDMVILDSPPVNMITDAAILGALADGVLLVARAGRTASPAMSYAMAQLGHVRARILGAVLNDIDFKRDSVYDSSYQYYSNARYTAETAK